MGLIRFDGIYCCIRGGNNDMLRFYEDGTAISAIISKDFGDSSAGIAGLLPVGDGFDKDNKEQNFVRGTYKAEGELDNATLLIEMRSPYNNNHIYNGTIEINPLGEELLHLDYYCDEKQDHEDEKDTFTEKREYVFYSNEDIKNFIAQADAESEFENEASSYDFDDTYIEF